jgi:hypothetical protein
MYARLSNSRLAGILMHTMVMLKCCDETIAEQKASHSAPLGREVTFLLSK